jgi:hypothetical protein
MPPCVACCGSCAACEPARPRAAPCRAALAGRLRGWFACLPADGSFVVPGGVLGLLESDCHGVCTVRVSCERQAPSASCQTCGSGRPSHAPCQSEVLAETCSVVWRDAVLQVSWSCGHACHAAGATVVARCPLIKCSTTSTREPSSCTVAFPADNTHSNILPSLTHTLVRLLPAPPSTCARELIPRQCPPSELPRVQAHALLPSHVPQRSPSALPAHTFNSKHRPAHPRRTGS